MTSGSLARLSGSPASNFSSEAAEDHINNDIFIKKNVFTVVHAVTYGPESANCAQHFMLSVVIRQRIGFPIQLEGATRLIVLLVVSLQTSPPSFPTLLLSPTFSSNLCAWLI